jgi:hypothetical protein
VHSLDNRVPDELQDNVINEWIDEKELETLDRAKIISLRLITHRALAFARADEVLEVSNPVLTLLRKIIIEDGQISDESMEG